jgi:type IV secretory pathway VirD2 relaxase
VVVSDGERENRDVLRPRVGGRGGEVPQERVPRFRNRLLARIARIGIASGAPPSRPRGTPSARDVPRPGAEARRCIVKARFVPMNANGKRAAALHLAYIERDGVEQDGSKGRLYSGAEIADAHALMSAPLEKEQRQFRFIVSPENAAEVDLTAFTRRLMAQVQADLGRPLVWAAVNHWNTDNPHVHVIVRGLDEAGRDVTIDGRYLSEGMRSRAQAILTNELGPRTELDVQDQLAREVRQERFTSLDRALQASQDSAGALGETSLPRQGRAYAARLIARLGRLEQLGLVTRSSATGWRFSEGWVETLRGLGQANDIVKRLNAAAPLSDPSRFVIVDGSQALPPIEGVVRSKGLHDELAGRPFAVIEAVDGRVFYVPIDVAASERMGEGDVVRLSVESRAEPSVPAGAGAAERQTARPRVRIQRLAPPLRAQLAYPGPTWLDGFDPAGAQAPAGTFGRELAACLARRVASVRAMGIEASVPADRVSALIALEAKALGARLAAERGVTFSESPTRLAGTLTLAPKLPSGREYAIVTDDESKRLWVVPANKQLRLLEGQQVRSWRTPDGRLLLARAAPSRTPGRGR